MLLIISYWYVKMENYRGKSSKIVENNLLKFYGLGCQKYIRVTDIIWLIDENINLERERCDLSHVINVCTFLSLYLTLLS